MELWFVIVTVGSTMTLWQTQQSHRVDKYAKWRARRKLALDYSHLSSRFDSLLPFCNWSNRISSLLEDLSWEKFPRRAGMVLVQGLKEGAGIGVFGLLEEISEREGTVRVPDLASILASLPPFWRPAPVWTLSLVLAPFAPVLAPRAPFGFAPVLAPCSRFCSLSCLEL